MKINKLSLGLILLFLFCVGLVSGIFLYGSLAQDTLAFEPDWYTKGHTYAVYNDIGENFQITRFYDRGANSMCFIYEDEFECTAIDPSWSQH